jgi:hypothetical protein
MSNFEFVKQFNIDCNILLDEWNKLTTRYSVFSTPKQYPRLLINHPSGYKDDIDIVNFTEQIGVQNFYQISNTFSLDNITKDFQNTYTEKVVKEVVDFLMDKYQVTVIKYAGLAPNFVMGMHKDHDLHPRFMLLVSGNDLCYMDTDDARYPINQIGGLYKLDRQQPHNPINLGTTWRIMIHFDVIPK